MRTKHKHIQSAAGVKDPKNDSPFNVVVVYEDLATGKHAKETYDFLVSRSGRKSEFNNRLWKFDVLQIPKIKESAAKDAVAADMIIFAAHGGEELPANVKSWIETWVGKKESHPGALVALFDDPDKRTRKKTSTRSYLQDVASRGKMDFFAQSADKKYSE